MTGLPLTCQLNSAVRERHGVLESTFGDERDRHGFAGKEPSETLYRRGVSVQRLRGEVSRLLDWFRACLRHGWIEGWHRLNPNQPIDLMEDRVDRRGRVKPGLGKGRLRRIMIARRNRGLNLPYGSVAERLGLVPTPPPAAAEPEPPPEA